MRTSFLTTFEGAHLRSELSEVENGTVDETAKISETVLAIQGKRSAAPIVRSLGVHGGSVLSNSGSTSGRARGQRSRRSRFKRESRVGASISAVGSNWFAATSRGWRAGAHRPAAPPSARLDALLRRCAGSALVDC